MPRGQASKDGETNVSANGYHYTRKDGKWRLTHHLVAEEKYGHKINTEVHVVRFIDGDRTNLHPDNIEVILKNKATARKRLAQIEARIKELEAERDELIQELALEILAFR